jgi:pantetheine-phosphate adenylyltransferase
MTIAVCPGSYDPVTLGHLDVIAKASKLFDDVVVVVAYNSVKNPLFTASERQEFIEKSVSELGITNVRVQILEGLLADFCKKLKADVIIKGLRHGGDYENELGMALLNRHLSGIETLFVPANNTHSHIASSYVKDVVFHGGDISDMVPRGIAEEIHKAFIKRGVESGE